jgi:type I restriction enzyme, S subunit
MCICSKNGQDDIVCVGRKLFSLAERIEARYAKARRSVAHRTPSLLAKALRGELVPTEAELARRELRGFESAQGLLKRIHAEAVESLSRKRPEQG